MNWLSGIGIVAIAAVASAAVTVKPVRIDEQRTKELEPPAPNGQMIHMGMSEGLRLTVKLEGAEMKGATQYGKLKITEAKDDAGTDLKPQQSMMMFGGADEFRKFEEPMMMRMRGRDAPAAPAAPQLDLQLGTPSRKATKIATLKGELEVLAGGETKTVQVKNPGALIGKKIPDPLLKQAGLEVEVADPKAGGMMMGDGPAVVLKITGDASALASVDVVDAQGKSLVQGSGSMSMGGTETRSIDLAQPPNAATTLKLTLNVGQKPIKVAFDLKDIPLP